MHVKSGQLRFAESHIWRKTRAQIWATQDLAALRMMFLLRRVRCMLRAAS
jgi:hypothetical protein